MKLPVFYMMAFYYVKQQNKGLFWGKLTFFLLRNPSKTMHYVLSVSELRDMETILQKTIILYSVKDIKLKHKNKK